MGSSTSSEANAGFYSEAICGPITIDGINIHPLKGQVHGVGKYLLDTNYDLIAEKLANTGQSVLTLDGFSLDHLLPVVKDDYSCLMFWDVDLTENPGRERLYESISDINSLILCAGALPKYLEADLKEETNNIPLAIGLASLLGGVLGASVYQGLSFLRGERGNFIKTGASFISGAIAVDGALAANEIIGWENGYQTACEMTETSQAINSNDSIYTALTAITLRKQLKFLESDVARQLFLDPTMPQTAILGFGKLLNMPQIRSIMENPQPVIAEILAKETKYLYDHTSLSLVELNQQVVDLWVSLAGVVPARLQGSQAVTKTAYGVRSLWLEHDMIGFPIEDVSYFQLRQKLGQIVERKLYSLL